MAIKFEDYYKTLGVDRKASADEIKRAYRELAKVGKRDRLQYETILQYLVVSPRS